MTEFARMEHSRVCLEFYSYNSGPHLSRIFINKYTGTVEITDPDGSKTKLNLHVTDHDGKIFFETKDPQ